MNVIIEYFGDKAASNKAVLANWCEASYALATVA